MFSRLVTSFIISAFAVASAAAFDLQGHRGARGLMPENTLPAFANALSIGVTTLEFDTGVTKDGVVIVSHNPSVEEDIARGADGEWVTGKPLLKEMTFEETQQFNMGKIKPGSRTAERFPKQMEVDGTRMPSLAQVFELTKKAKNDAVRFNIETKINPLKPDNTVSPQVFAKALVDVVQKYEMESRTTIQSFDWRTLQIVQKIAPKIETVYLSAEQEWMNTINGANGDWTAGFKIADHNGSLAKMIKAAGGSVWSPFHRDVTKEKLAAAQAEGLKVIPWTVNDPADMKNLIEMGVDGLISDYPDVLRRVAQELKIAVAAPTPVTP